MPQAIRPGRIALALLCVVSGGAWATEYGMVISSTPVVASMPVPQRQCTEEQRVYPPRTTGAGALIGAIAGAAIGNGLGAGQAAATGLGMVAGSVIGNGVESTGTPARPAPTTATPTSTAVTVIEYGDVRPAPRVVYFQPEYYPVPAYAYGWPHTTLGLGLWVGPGWHGRIRGWGGHHHHYHYRR